VEKSPLKKRVEKIPTQKRVEKIPTQKRVGKISTQKRFSFSSKEGNKQNFSIFPAPFERVADWKVF